MAGTAKASAATCCHRRLRSLTINRQLARYAELFERICIMALKLKVKLSLSKSRYTFVFPAVGAEFDPTTMKQHTWQEMSSQIDIDEPSIEEKRVAKLVKLCLFPALYAYPKTSPEYASRPLEIDMKSQLVDYRNFFVDDGELTTGEPIIVFKALVQL